MSSVTVRPFQGRDTQVLINLWNESVPADGITLDLLERKILLDANFDSEGFLVAEKNENLVGLIVCLVRQVPMEGVGLQENLGWITMTGVHPDHRHKGIGTQLWKKAEEFFIKRNRKTISIATYAPNYFIPGIDIKEYEGAVKFFEKHGFVQGAKPLSMDTSIVTFRIPDEILRKEERLKQDGITVQHYQREWLMPYLDFMKKYMPGDWVRLARENLALLTIGKFKEEQILLAIKESEIIGYAQFEEEHFGPFGVRDDYQGRGIGTVLLARTIQTMHNRGHHCAWFLWTDDKASQVYQKVGFKESRRFVVMKKELA